MSNKQKYIDSAQKNIKKKLFSRAIKDYQKVVEVDPRDIRSRQRLAELFVKTNQTGEAFEQYEAVAKYFASNGFYLKAIAIYKQMQRLDPSQINIFSRLAELNEKQGLVGNALAELRHLVGYYEKNNMVADAIKTLEKMRDLDSGSINVQVKLAEVYANNERVADGLAEFKDILKQLEGKQDFDKILRLYRIFLPLFPQNIDLQKGLALTLIQVGDSSKGITLLQQLLRNHTCDAEILPILGTTYQDLEDYKNARLTYLHLLKLDSRDLDARESLVQCYLKEKNYPKALAELEDWKEAFLKINRLERLQEFYESLQSMLPGNQQVLQTLDSIYEMTGDGGKRLDMVSGTVTHGEIGSVRANVAEETLSDSLLGDMGSGDDNLDFDVSDLIGDSVGAEIPVAEEGSELELELLDEVEPEEEDEFIELNLTNSPDAEKSNSFEEMSLDFDLDDDDISAPSRDVDADLEEAEFYLQQGLFEEAEKVCISILEQLPDSMEVKTKLEEIRSRRDVQGLQGETSTELQDLAAELLEEGFPEMDIELTDEAGRDQFESFSDSPPKKTENTSRKVFRTDVDEQIAADDMESHYNLGIAYREMGLFSDAVAEFGKAERDPARFVDCQTLKGLCCVDQGDFEKGEEAFLAALAGDDLAEGQKLSLHYELGLLYENWERPLDALDSFQYVADSELFFRDVADRLEQLRKKLGLDDDSDQQKADAKGESLVPKDRISFL
ncbi:tetratricopeptide repeat protein [Geopsychrobacter electrodiphilus]|uniref:tetratricopeptide repeat protein n=1 Tax=Geopsychrobacter electrodiphilus TaxID=225196 RepID=UPI00035E3575|nr:tetratricopeptide repeat protein [Geopsychrobacter electrodiphilus]